MDGRKVEGRRYVCRWVGGPVCRGFPSSLNLLSITEYRYTLYIYYSITEPNPPSEPNTCEYRVCMLQVVAHTPLCSPPELVGQPLPPFTPP